MQQGRPRRNRPLNPSQRVTVWVAGASLPLRFRTLRTTRKRIPTEPRLDQRPVAKPLRRSVVKSPNRERMVGGRDQERGEARCARGGLAGVTPPGSPLY